MFYLHRTSVFSLLFHRILMDFRGSWGPRVPNRWPKNHQSAKITSQMMDPALPNGHWTPKIMKKRRENVLWSAKIEKCLSFPCFSTEGSKQRTAFRLIFSFFCSKSGGTVSKKRSAFRPCRGLREKRPAFRLVFEAFSVRTSEAQYRFLQALGALAG